MGNKGSFLLSVNLEGKMGCEAIFENIFFSK